MFGRGKKKKDEDKNDVSEVIDSSESQKNWKGKVSRFSQYQDGDKVTWSFVLNNELGEIHIVVIERAGGFGVPLMDGDTVEIKDDFHVKGNVIHAKKIFIESFGTTIEGKKYWPDACNRFT